MLGLKENIIVSTIDFNKKLMETLCEDNHDNDVESCLISGESLEERPIILNCSHKFNYDSIFKRIHVIIVYYLISDMACKRIHAIGVYSFATMGRNI